MKPRDGECDDSRVGSNREQGFHQQGGLKELPKRCQLRQLMGMVVDYKTALATVKKPSCQLMSHHQPLLNPPKLHGPWSMAHTLQRSYSCLGTNMGTGPIMLWRQPLGGDPRTGLP